MRSNSRLSRPGVPAHVPLVGQTDQYLPCGNLVGIYKPRLTIPKSIRKVCDSFRVSVITTMTNCFPTSGYYSCERICFFLGHLNDFTHRGEIEFVWENVVRSDSRQPKEFLPLLKKTSYLPYAQAYSSLVKTPLGNFGLRSRSILLKLVSSSIKRNARRTIFCATFTFARMCLSQ